jgi:alkylation response protein AidB-like acyl-CoA dehydrogenase
MTWTQEQLEIQALAHEFAEGELRGASAQWDGARDLDEQVFGRLAELGFLGMLIPEEYGGLDFDLGTYLLVLEELAWGDASVALSVAIHSGPVAGLLRRHGTDEQKQRWLPELASGASLGAFALSEPEAGSDAAAISTKAERSEGGWTLNGEKRWVTNGGRAGLVVTFARTGEDGISAFLVSPEADGYSVGKRELTMGFRASQTVGVEFDGVALGAEALVGDVGRGLPYALEALDLGRIGIAAQAVGIGRSALEHAAKYALEREQFGRPIAEFGATQAKLAEMARQLSGARLLTHHAGASLETVASGSGHARTGADGVSSRAAIAKLAASEAATWSADEAVQIFGGYGYMRHYPVEQLLRDAKGTEIYEGTNEIMRMVIAREVLRDAATE